MSKERLEELLKESPFNQHTEEFLIKLEDMNEITKIVQELEEFNRILSSDKSMFIEELVREQQQNKRYREALIKVKLGSESDVIHYSTRLKSINKIAVEALEDES